MKKNKQNMLNFSSEIKQQFSENPMKIPYLFTKIEAKDMNNNLSEPAIKRVSCEKYNTLQYQCVTIYRPIAKF